MSWSNWTSTTSTCSSSGNYVWGQWNLDTGGTTCGTWGKWNDHYYTVTTSSATTTTWTNWNAGYVYYDAPTIQELTEEQKAEQARKDEEARLARAAREAERKRKDAEEAKRKEEARKKAYELLVSLLNEEQINDLEKTKSFGFISPSGKVYRIREGWSHNIELITGKKKRTLCCHPKKAVPIHDNLTAQLLLLKYQEEEFLKMANKGYEQDV